MEEKARKEVRIVTGGKNKSISDIYIYICPTILSRIYKGCDTYGIPMVIEYAKSKQSTKGNS